MELGVKEVGSEVLTGRNVKAARALNHDLKASDAAKALGIYRTTLVDIEKNRIRLDQDEYRRMIEAMPAIAARVARRRHTLVEAN